MKNTLYNKEFFSVREKHRVWQARVGVEIALCFNIKSVIDFGCSIGSFLEGFSKAGASVEGFEFGFEYSKEYTPKCILPFIEYGDVTKPIECGMVDCTFSIEVAEHIEPEGTEQFIKNLCEHSLKYIILSAAPIGQGGVGHINCRPYSFWKDALLKYNFIYQEEVTKQIIKKLAKIPGVSKWIKSNLMVFSK